MNSEEEKSAEARSAKGGSDSDGSNARKAAALFFMTNAPPGALREVMENCELLMDASAVSSRSLAEALEQSAEEQRLILALPSGTSSQQSALATQLQAVLSPSGRIAKSTYLCSSTKQVLTISASGSDLNVSASPAAADAFPAQVESFRAALQAELTDYVKRCFACGALRQLLSLPVSLQQAVSVLSHAAAPSEASQPPLRAILAVHAENTSSCWACDWKSEWRFVFDPLDAKTGVFLEGEARVRCYLHEDASVQANFSRSFASERRKNAGIEGDQEETLQAESGSSGSASSSSVNPSPTACSSSEAAASSDPCCIAAGNSNSPAALARQMAEAVERLEAQLQQEIQDFFARRALRVSKVLRRVLPVHGKPFDWRQQSLQLKPQQLATNETA
ncbi:capping protein alpha-like [Cyclospora cayetanensis]|uniref:Capping protein alpha-like n=1 Tax=Cyclospora cayetanensis TaxID=88456 RepID=A0A1D3D9N3_9EIME|nr:capping protein alpha-like [Cyclospora cayetanensis]